jgi:hypothetical protein
MQVEVAVEGLGKHLVGATRVQKDLERREMEGRRSRVKPSIML